MSLAVCRPAVSRSRHDDHVDAWRASWLYAARHFALSPGCQAPSVQVAAATPARLERDGRPASPSTR